MKVANIEYIAYLRNVQLTCVKELRRSGGNYATMTITILQFSDIYICSLIILGKQTIRFVPISLAY
jgi:hypothetical protein